MLGRLDVPGLGIFWDEAFRFSAGVEVENNVIYIFRLLSFLYDVKVKETFLTML